MEMPLNILGRYANHIAITNTRIISVNEKEVSFHAKDYRTNKQKIVTLSCVEFIRRFMMHVLPCSFQKIRYYEFLNNRWKSKNLSIIFRIQGAPSFYIQAIQSVYGWSSFKSMEL